MVLTVRTNDTQDSFYSQAGAPGQAAAADAAEGGGAGLGEGRQGPLHRRQEPQRQQGRRRRDQHQGENVHTY